MAYLTDVRGNLQFPLREGRVLARPASNSPSETKKIGLCKE